MITLELSLAETNLVLDALGRLPYAQVYELIGKIHKQAEAFLETGENRKPAEASPQEGSS